VMEGAQKNPVTMAWGLNEHERRSHASRVGHNRRKQPALDSFLSNGAPANIIRPAVPTYQAVFRLNVVKRTQNPSVTTRKMGSAGVHSTNNVPKDADDWFHEDDHIREPSCSQGNIAGPQQEQENLSYLPLDTFPIKIRGRTKVAYNYCAFPQLFHDGSCVIPTDILTSHRGVHTGSISENSISGADARSRSHP
jgi:hypothetical protein